jgi:hypothetical protein
MSTPIRKTSRTVRGIFSKNGILYYGKDFEWGHKVHFPHFTNCRFNDIFLVRMVKYEKDRNNIR